MYEVRNTLDAKTDFQLLPMAIQLRVQALYQRLARWPDVSGAKPLRGGMAGAYRLRTGDYRVLFTVKQDVKRIEVFRIAHRKDVYD